LGGSDPRKHSRVKRLLGEAIGSNGGFKATTQMMLAPA
jgi:hypothetical protein